jgi:hypothetical protein
LLALSTRPGSIRVIGIAYDWGRGALRHLPASADRSLGEHAPVDTLGEHPDGIPCFTGSKRRLYSENPERTTRIGNQGSGYHVTPANLSLHIHSQIFLRGSPFIRAILRVSHLLCASVAARNALLLMPLYRQNRSALRLWVSSKGMEAPVRTSGLRSTVALDASVRVFRSYSD